ncbi:asparagine synthase (glutamine-hydrolyzing) [Ferrovibrio sp.]|uniref:asparagine synthase (glutamine-hydrolyzing) n=1 Tax=Ferrovibrio sp. TaxID=1917215 RepID=UPI0035AE3D9C
MCGIAGLMRADGAAPDPALLRAMLDAIAHRGPDGEGIYAADGVALGQRRLAIIDLQTGDQPIVASDGTALVANGEIYNYRELYARLPDQAFATKSDCEPPLHLYRKEGLGFTEHLRGMYALAIYDPASRQLLLTRDPFGIKPLYYAQAAGYLIFASEIGALFATGLLQKQLRPEARDELLNLQFTTGAETIFKGVYRLLPGELLVCAKGEIIGHHRRAALAPAVPDAMDAQAALLRLNAELAEAVDLHQRSDVPYGLFLSGGIDSSILLAMMARLNDRPVLSYSLGFPDSGLHDERGLAEKLARQVGAQHRSVDFVEADFWSLLPAMAQAMDDPAADYACLPTLKLAQLAASEVKVVLSGEGGDEIFAGYGRYRSATRFFWRKPMRAKGTLIGQGLYRQDPTEWRAGFAQAEAMAAEPGEDRLQTAQRLDMADWLPNDLLLKADRCLMRHALEGRTPFLDCGEASRAGLSAFGFGLADKLKLRHGQGKYLLRQWLAQHLPEAEPFSRKRGFTVPVGRWMAHRGGKLAPLVAAQPGVVECFRPEAVQALFASGAEKHPAAAWSILFYALWHQHHVMGRSAEGDAFALLAA